MRQLRWQRNDFQRLWQLVLSDDDDIHVPRVVGWITDELITYSDRRLLDRMIDQNQWPALPDEAWASHQGAV